MAIKISGTTVIDNSQNITNAGIVTATSFTGDGSQLTNLPGGGGNTLEATASGTLADGSKVIINTDGTVSVVAQTETTGPGTGPATLFTNHNTDYISGVFDSNSNRVVIFYRYNDASQGYKGVALVGEISGGSISFGTPVDFETTGDGVTTIDSAFDSTNNKVVVGYRLYESNGNKYHRAKVGTVDPSDNSITFGSAAVINSNGESSDFNMTFDPASGKIVVAYRDEGNSSYGTAKVGTVSGTSISFGSATVFHNTGSSTNIGMAVDTSNNKIALVSQNWDGSANSIDVRVGTISGTSITFGSSTQIYTHWTNGTAIAFDSSVNKIVVVHNNSNSVGSAYQLNAYVGTISGTSITFGSAQTVVTQGGLGAEGLVYDSGSQKLLIVYSNQNNSYIDEYLYATVSGSSINFGSATTLGTTNNGYTGVVYDSNANQSLIYYQDESNSRYGAYHVVGLSGFPAPQLGSATDIVSVNHTYFTSAVYDSSNNKVVVAYWDSSNNSYGTATVGTVSGTSISFGTPVVFNSDYTRSMQLAYDSTNNKVVIAYRTSNSYYGAAVVGEVSGTSITFGTPTTFSSSSTTNPSPVYDSTNNKVVIAYEDVGNSSYGKAIVGEVSGTSISFGSAVTFNSNASYYIGATYDSTNGKVVIAYADYGQSAHGVAIVGEVSGTSISFPSSSTKFVTGQSDITHSLAFDSTNGKVVIAYRDVGNSYYGTAILGTVSGTSISFNGSSTVFDPTSGGASSNYSAVYDSTNSKVIISYNSTSGKAIAGTVSGDSISFGSSFEIESGGVSYVSSVYDSSNDRVVTVYNDTGNNYRGTAVVFTPHTISSNLTAENFIGISDGTYTNGQTATIQLTGAVDDAQSSLTPGQAYYVQNDGTLSTTAGSPSVFAGTSLASTKLIVRG